MHFFMMRLFRIFKWEVLVIKTKHHYILQTLSEKAGYM